MSLSSTLAHSRLRERGQRLQFKHDLPCFKFGVDFKNFGWSGRKTSEMDQRLANELKC